MGVFVSVIQCERWEGGDGSGGATGSCDLIPPHGVCVCLCVFVYVCVCMCVIMYFL